MPILRHIYNPASGSYQDVEVTQEVYNCYRRTGWRIQKNDQRFFAHEIQFSSLIGGGDSAFENFSEFHSLAHDPQHILCVSTEDLRIFEAFCKLSPSDQRILRLLVIEGNSERWYASRTGLPQQTVHNRKRNALRKLERLLKTK